MAIQLAEPQKSEVLKILKYLKNMEAIVRTSPNPEQKARVQKEMLRQRARLSELLPGLDISKLNADMILRELGPAAGAGAGPNLDPESVTPEGRAVSGAAYSLLRKFEVEKASPHSSDPDVNFLASVFRIIMREYWPALSEQHCQLDFSRAAERDVVRSQLENLGRNLKVLVETIEEYAGAEKQDFREQLLKMKNRQTRAFIFDTNEVLKRLRDYMQVIAGEIQSGGGSIMNKMERLKFNPRFEEAKILEGRTVAEGLLEFAQFIEEAIAHLNLPTLKSSKKEPGHPA